MPPKFVRNPAGSDFSHARREEKTSLLDAQSDDDDFFLTGPNVRPGGSKSDPKIDRLQNQVNDVVDVMQSNVSRVLERGDKLEDLHDKSDSLAGNADMFRSRARGLHKKMWWKNCKMKLALAVIILIIFLVIIIPIIVKSQKN
ncbi:vesicle-associated membrane protein 4-like [Saccostrea cucullata]|uniref:vesicle-associated membrane protein 4-like n=1 Tax=Saccostrea cuccullata TaxID=36930 RepID=UPI002ED549A2